MATSYSTHNNHSYIYIQPYQTIPKIFAKVIGLKY